MLRKIIGVGLIVLGLVAAGLGTASATVWRQSDTVVASTSAGEGETMLVTDPGVLDMVGDSVTIKATAPGDQPVVLAVGRDVDVDGWVGDDPYVRVTGMSNMSTLSADLVAAPTEEPAEDATEEPTDGAETEEEPVVGPDPSGSDMWVAVSEGEGEATLRWTDQPGRWSLIAAGVGEGAQAPSLELTWPRETSTPWLWPGVIVGAVLVLLGILVLVLRRKRRRPAKSRRAVARSADGSGASGTAPGDPDDGGTAGPDRPTPTTEVDAAETAQFPAVVDVPADDAPAAPVVMTRREMRERAAREQAARDSAAGDETETPAITTPKKKGRLRRKSRRETLPENAAAAPPASSAPFPAAPEPGATPPPFPDEFTSTLTGSDADVPAPPSSPVGGSDEGSAPGWPGSAIADESSRPAPRSSTADAWRRTWGFDTTNDDTDGGER